MTQITVEMPERDSYGEIMKGYFSLMRGFGIELGMRCDAVLSELDGVNWWAELVSQRRDEQENRWKGSVNRFDPGLMLPEYVWRLDSPLAKALSSKPDSRAIAKKIQIARNSWVHFTTAPGPVELQEVATLVKQFAGLNDLKIGTMATRMINRLERIRNGRYQPFNNVIARWRIDNPATPVATESPEPVQTMPGVEQPPQPDPAAETIEVEAPAIERRPPIGGRWAGEIPVGRFIPSAIGDLVDPSRGEGLRARVEADFWPRKRRLWLAARPLGGVWVDEVDGAVGGYVDNVPRLLGYLGDEPDDGLARGFLTSRYYEVLAGRIVDLDSGLALVDQVAEDARDAVEQIQQTVADASPEQAGLRLSTYGDLVAITDEGAIRVATIEPEHWFPGHLA